MKISVRVVTRASKNEVIKEKENVYKVKVTCPPVDGEANKEIIKLLSKEFNVSKSNIEIVKGHSSRNKIVEIGPCRDCR